MRTNIATSTNKKLHPLLFRALRKSLFKPSAFFRGILLPMAEGGDCTLREAVVLGAIVSSMTIPPIHASAAILKLCKMTHYSGACGMGVYSALVFADSALGKVRRRSFCAAC